MLNITFDGDTVSINLTYSNEAIAEANKFFKSRIAYLKAGGGVGFSVNVGTLKLTSHYMTGEPKERK